MAQPSIIQDGIERFESTFKSLERDWKRLQKRAEKRRREMEKSAEKQFKRIQTELRKNPVVKRAETLRDETVQVLGEGVEGLLGNLRIASHSEITRLERKVNTLGRKVRELEKETAA